jgi:DNA-directed RNA polymerase beta subunit
MYVPTRLINKETGENIEQEVFIGDLPLMTERGTFIINWAERVIVNQIVRSPGVYYKAEIDKNGRRTYSASLIPNRGAWLKFETDKNGLVWVRIDKTRKLSAQVLLKAIGLSDNEIFDSLRHPEFYQKTLDKEGNPTEERHSSTCTANYAQGNLPPSPADNNCSNRAFLTINATISVALVVINSTKNYASTSPITSAFSPPPTSYRRSTT